jgi:hypothetical protein
VQQSLQLTISVNSSSTDMNSTLKSQTVIFASTLAQLLNTSEQSIEVLNGTMTPLPGRRRSQAFLAALFYRLTVSSSLASSFATTSQLRTLLDGPGSQSGAILAQCLVDQMNHFSSEAQVLALKSAPSVLVPSQDNAFINGIDLTWSICAYEPYVKFFWSVPESLLEEASGSLRETAPSITAPVSPSSSPVWYSLQLRRRPTQAMLTTFVQTLTPLVAAGRISSSAFFALALPWTTIPADDSSTLQLPVCTFHCSQECLCPDASYEVRIQLFSGMHAPLTSPTVVVAAGVPTASTLVRSRLSASLACVHIDFGAAQDR